MDVSDGYRALALIKERFGQKISPDAAFKLIDHTLKTGHATNLGLKQVICATAFDRGTFAGLWRAYEQCVDHAAPGLDWCSSCTRATEAITAINAFLALPSLADPVEAAESEPEAPRIIAP